MSEKYAYKAQTANDPFNSLIACGHFCLLQITFAMSLVPDSVGPDLDPNHLTLIVFLKEFSEKLILKKVST